MLSIMNIQHSANVSKYAWNTVDPNDTSSYPFYFNYTHQYIDRCHLLNNVTPNIFIVCAFYLLLSLLMLHLYHKHGRNNQYPL